MSSLRWACLLSALRISSCITSRELHGKNEGNALSWRALHFLWATHLPPFSRPHPHYPHIASSCTFTAWTWWARALRCLWIKKQIKSDWSWLCLPGRWPVIWGVMLRFRDWKWDGPKICLLNEKAVGKACWSPHWVLLSKCGNVLIEFNEELKKKSLTGLPPTDWWRQITHAHLPCLAPLGRGMNAAASGGARTGSSQNLPCLRFFLRANCSLPSQWVLSKSRQVPETSWLTEMCTGLLKAASMWRGNVPQLLSLKLSACFDSWAGGACLSSGTEAMTNVCGVTTVSIPKVDLEIFHWDRKVALEPGIRFWSCV